MAQVPQVFLSSTLYDLLQVRTDVGAFVRSLGYHLLDSTDAHFYADPAVDTYEACLEEVKRSDMLILVIGGRFGAEPPGSGRSITNQEWELAHARRIPIFTFVDRKVWDLLTVWEANPSADFTPHVQDPRVFEFIRQVSRTSRNNWVWPFDSAEEIVDVLREQWATMFAEHLRQRLDNDIVWVSPNRHSLAGDYVKYVREAVKAVDMLGVSLATIARSSNIGETIAEVSDRGVPIRVLIMDKDSPSARIRGAEEYGEETLFSELEAMSVVWDSLTKDARTAEVRHYDARAANFFLRIDDARFLSFYPLGDSGANAPTFAFRRTGEAANYFQKRFDALWAATPPRS
jgi:hypothetical protein